MLLAENVPALDCDWPKQKFIQAAVILVHFNVYLTSYHSIDFCSFPEKVIFIESVGYGFLCLKSKMSNKKRGKT